jgi:putative two-component system response regulator
MSYDDALKIIAEGRGTQFDPVIADAVLVIHEQFKEIAENYK